MRVALRTEGVDRNWMPLPGPWEAKRSPSARRAWIEIYTVKQFERNRYESPSARRAWIEIEKIANRLVSLRGSPSARRAWIEIPL